MEDLYTLWNETVVKTAHFVIRDFPGAELDDLIQDLWAFIFSTPSLKHPDEIGNTTILIRVAKTAAWKQRADSLWASVQYAYRPSDVRKILETVYSPEDWDHSFVPEDAQSIDQDDCLTVNSDILAAIKYLPREYQKALISRYKYGVTPESNSADYRRLNRAVVRLVDTLNTYRGRPTDGPGSRRAMSNAEALTLLSSDDS